MKLTVKEEKFVQGLFKGLSQRKAYKEAFDAKNMKDKTIDNKACDLNKKEEIRVRLTELQNEVAAENKWTREKLVEEFAAVKEKCMQEVEVLDKFGNPTGEYVFKEAGVINALKEIGKLSGHYVEKVEHSGEIGMPGIKMGK